MCAFVTEFPTQTPSYHFLIFLSEAGYHIYCAAPALKRVPEGDWICQECVQDGKAIRIGDPMFGKYRSTPGWYECKVVGEADGGRRLVEWEDGDKEDT